MPEDCVVQNMTAANDMATTFMDEQGTRQSINERHSIQNSGGEAAYEKEKPHILEEKALRTNVEEVSDGSNEEERYPTGFKFWILMLNLAGVIMLGAIDMSIVATAVPRITDHFHTVADVGWYSIAFRLTQCATKFLYGKAYKVFRIKRVFLLANAFSLLGSLLCATAVSSPMLVVGRAVAGIGTAGLDAGAIMMLIQSTPLRKRPMFQGMWAAIEGLSTVAGPIIGGALTQTAGWRWCFWINLPLGGATLLLTLVLFSEKPKDEEVTRLSLKDKLLQLDFVSNLVCLVPGLTCLFLAFSWAGTKYSWSNGHVIGLIVTFAVLAGAFIYNQYRRGDAAAIPIRIVKQRNVLASLIFVTFLNSAGNTLEYYLPIYYQAVRGYSPGASGLLMLPILIGGTAGAVGAGFFTSACGYYAPSMVFACIIMPVGAGLTTTFGSGTNLAKLIVYIGLFGFGYGVGASAPSTAVQVVLPDTDVSMGLAALSFGSALGPALFIAVAQVIFTNQLSTNLNVLVPGLQGSNLDNTGLTELVDGVAPARSNAVLLAISKSVSQTWYLVIALSCAMIIGTLPIRWISVKQADPNATTDTEEVQP